MKHKIVYVQNGGNVISGQELSIFNIITHLDRDKYYPIYILSYEGSFTKLLRERGIEVKIMKLSQLHKKTPLPYIFSVTRMANYFRKNKISLIHTSGAYPNQFCSIAAKLSRIPIICHIHTGLYTQGELRRMFINLADRIIVVSNAVGELFGKDGQRPSKVITVYNGVDLSGFDAQNLNGTLREELKIRPQTPIIGIVGRVVEAKGVDHFLSMAKMINPIFPEVRFLVVGEDWVKKGTYREKMQALAKELNISDKVIFTGHRNDIPEVIQAIDIVVIATTIKNDLGMVVIEAMAMGKPVVATKIEGITEVIEDGKNGLLVPLANPKALAEAVLKLLRDKDMASQIGQAAKEHVSRYFNLKIQVEKIQNIYQELLDET